MNKKHKSDKNRIVAAFRALLRGVVKLALRNGLNHNEFSTISKELFVEVAQNDYGIDDRPTNSSRIALMTGLNRKEVKRIQDIVKNVNKSHKKLKNNHIEDVLSRWHNDPDYLDNNGKPKLLSYERETPSFVSLVTTSPASTDIQATTILRELKRSQAIKELPSGKLKVLKQHFVPNFHNDASLSPELVDPEKITQGCSMLVDHINTVFYNLYNDISGEPTRFELKATNDAISPDGVLAFQKFVREKGMALLQEADKDLAESAISVENAPGKNDVPKERIGVGIYLIRGENVIDQ